MKTRNGFVSNSSSSSFIIGAAKVLDKNKLLEEVKDLEDCKILTRKGFEAYVLSRETYDFSLWENYVVMKAHTNDQEECFVDLDENENVEYLVVNIGHNEDDGPFCRDDGFYGLDYSIVNESYFEQNYPRSYRLLKLLQGKEGITEHLSYRFGVSRCG